MAVIVPDRFSNERSAVSRRMEAEMSILVSCACGKQFRARDEHAGKRGRCPGCGQAVQIPGAGGFDMLTSKRRPASNPAAGGGSFHVSEKVGGIAMAVRGLARMVVFVKDGPLGA